EALVAEQQQRQLDVVSPRTPEQIAATVAWVQSLADSDTAPPSAPVGVGAKAHALADELWLAYEQEDDLKAGMAYADACGRVRTLAAALAQQPAAAPCCMCGNPVDTRENGTPGAELARRVEDAQIGEVEEEMHGLVIRAYPLQKGQRVRI